MDQFKEYLLKLTEGKVPPQFLKKADKSEDKEEDKDSDKDGDDDSKGSKDDSDKKEDKKETKGKFPFTKKKEDKKEEKDCNESSDSFKVMYKDGSNMTFLTVSNKGTSLKAVNQSDRSVALSNLAFKITPADFEKGGYENSGKADQDAFVKDSAHIAYNASKGDPEKFAKEFSKLMKITFNFVDSGDFNESEDLEEAEESESSWTKEELIAFINQLDDDELQEVGDYLMDEVFSEDEEEEEEDSEEDEELDEAKKFKGPNIQKLRQIKKRIPINVRKKMAKKAKIYFKKNKARIVRKQKINAKRPESKHTHHKGV